jgi:hypothetical protein
VYTPTLRQHAHVMCARAKMLCSCVLADAFKKKKQEEKKSSSLMLTVIID